MGLGNDGEPFEQQVQQKIESTGLKYERHPLLKNGQTPDGVIHHQGGRLFVECKYSPTQGKSCHISKPMRKLCSMASPMLHETGLGLYVRAWPSKLGTNGRWIGEKGRSVLEETPSKRDADSFVKNILSIHANADDGHGFHFDLPFRGVQLEGYISEYNFDKIANGSCPKNHPGCDHSSPCLVNLSVFTESWDYTKCLRDGKHLIEKAMPDQERTDGLEGDPIIAVVRDDDIFGKEYWVQLSKGVWTGGKRNRPNVPAIWVFDINEQTRPRPMLIINPYIDQRFVSSMIPQELMNISDVEWNRETTF